MDADRIEKVLTPLDGEAEDRRERKVRRDFWDKFQAFAARIPFAEDVAAAYYCATDPNTPFKVRATLFAALAYFIMPFDFLPDLLVLVGMTDDIAVLMAAFTIVSGNITEEHRAKARARIEEMEAA